ARRGHARALCQEDASLHRGSRRVAVRRRRRRDQRPRAAALLRLARRARPARHDARRADALQREARARMHAAAGPRRRGRAARGEAQSRERVMAKILDMPKLSPTMEEGVLQAWHKNEGDSVAVDDLLAEVETDKATMEFRAFDKGTLLKILVPAGSNVKLGQPVAILGNPGEDVSALLSA